MAYCICEHPGCALPHKSRPPESPEQQRKQQQSTPRHPTSISTAKSVSRCVHHQSNHQSLTSGGRVLYLTKRDKAHSMPPIHQSHVTARHDTTRHERKACFSFLRWLDLIRLVRAFLALSLSLSLSCPHLYCTCTGVPCSS